MKAWNISPEFMHFIQLFFLLRYNLHGYPLMRKPFDKTKGGDFNFKRRIKQLHAKVLLHPLSRNILPKMLMMMS